MRYQTELSQVKWSKCMQMQLAMHCAPVLADVKPSNAVTLDFTDSKEFYRFKRISAVSERDRDPMCPHPFRRRKMLLASLPGTANAGISDGNQKSKIFRKLRLFILSDSKYPLYTQKTI